MRRPRTRWRLSSEGWRPFPTARSASSTSSTIEGEPPGIWAFLGSDRLGRPIAEHTPDLVLHGHGHAGTYEGFIGAVPVYNVSLPVMGRDFAVFELSDTTVRDVSAHPGGGETHRRKEVH